MDWVSQDANGANMIDTLVCLAPLSGRTDVEAAKVATPPKSHLNPAAQTVICAQSMIIYISTMFEAIVNKPNRW